MTVPIRPRLHPAGHVDVSHSEVSGSQRKAPAAQADNTRAVKPAIPQVNTIKAQPESPAPLKKYTSAITKSAAAPMKPWKKMESK